MQSLIAKRILLGVSGGIAAYKSGELVRGLRAAGAEVRVVMTAGACRFITPLTLQALSGQPVRTELFDEQAEAGMGHIELARWADAVLVAPASADLLARLARGRADDLLATLCLATRAPLLLAPAMNRAMWDHPATRDNVRLLAERGARLLGPEAGEQACGETGPGRMREPQDLITDLAAGFETGALAGRQVLVTAGPTREPVDPVRYITNRSSGRMGYAVAAAAREAGARVTLISGPVALDCPPGVECVAVETAQQMQRAVQERLAGCDIFIGAAAVADYRPAQAAGQKLKKCNANLSLELVRNPDILAGVAAASPRPFTVGFAAETQDLGANARSKRMRKSLDLIAANLVGSGQGFDAEDNALTLYWEGGSQALPRQPKSRLARELIAIIAQRFHDALSTNTTKATHAEKGSAQGS